MAGLLRGILALALLAGVAHADEADLEKLKAQMAEMQGMIQRLQAEVAALKGQEAAAPPTGPAVPTSAAAPPRTAAQDEVRGDALSVARVDNAPLDPTREGFIDLPGTDAAFSLTGYAKLDAIFDPHRAGNPDKFVTSSIPVDVPAGGEYTNFNVHARQTRLDLNLVKGTRSTKGGPLRFFVEADFFGSGGDSAFRMRHAYGSKANLVLGWTWSALADPDAFPDTLDFEMSPGTTQNRQPQIRYTAPFGKDRQTSLAFSIEKPKSDITYAGVTNVNRYPDVITRFRHEFGRGHIQAGAAFRSIGASDQQTATDTAFGLVGNVLGRLGVFRRDSVVFDVAGGPGAAHYIDNLSGLGLDAAINTAGRQLEAVTSVGAYAAYQHHWTKTVRSTFSYGFDNVENSIYLPPTAIRRNHYVSGNVVLQMFKSTILGLEYLYGRNELQSGQDGWADRIQLSIKYDLTK